MHPVKPTMFTLRDLPLPAKLVMSVFLLAVGLGYFSALVQLHMQHSSKSGDHLPSPSDVVAVFAGKKKYDPNTPKPVSKLETLIMGPIENAPWNGTGSMAGAFFHKDDGTYNRELGGRRAAPDPDKLKALNAEREGERQAVKAWINLPDSNREEIYKLGVMEKPSAVETITGDYLEGGSIKLKQILTDRCVRCHAKDGDQDKYPFECYEDYKKYLAVPAVDEPDAQGWVPSNKQMDIPKLTQSTHAHLLSFAMLFGLTGLIFAFTSYPGIVKLLFAPIVLIAQVADVSCWWLARVDYYGPYFAYAILGTGSIVGLGLLVHILGSLFDLYGKVGRRVLIVVLALGAGGFGVLYSNAIEPALQAQKNK